MTTHPAAADSAAAVRRAGLRYVSDAMPGIHRRRQGSGWRYLDAAGRPVRDHAERRRIAALAIPPAWTDVWICVAANGHLQATGRDARRRKQYRYHDAWREVRDETKFDRMVPFGQALPRLRARIGRDLALPGVPREKIVATVVCLLETTLIRVGNEEYTRANGSFGLTTLRNRHVTVAGDRLRFQFRGKSGKEHSVAIADPRLARVVRACRDLPGHELFQYLDEAGDRQAVDSADVNAYLRAASGEPFTAKDFRTWGGTVLAVAALLAEECSDPAPATAAQAAAGIRDGRRAVNDAIKQVAARLGNRPATCRKYYVHPGVIDAYLAGTLDIAPIRAGAVRKLEQEVLAFLRRLPAVPPPPRRRRRARKVAAGASRRRGRRTARPGNAARSAGSMPAPGAHRDD